jgi:hypothetical protein
VKVFCSGHSCSNNSGGWPLRPISISHKEKDFAFFAAKDRARADEASIGLMIWDKKSIGTLMNVMRMIANHKRVVLYLAPEHEFLDLKSFGDLQALIESCPSRVREKEEGRRGFFCTTQLVLIPVEPGAFYILDRGYLDFARWEKIAKILSDNL